MYVQRQPVFALQASPGTLHLRLRAAAPRVAEGEAWWARQDSNLQPDRYERQSNKRARLFS